MSPSLGSFLSWGGLLLVLKGRRKLDLLVTDELGGHRYECAGDRILPTQNGAEMAERPHHHVITRFLQKQSTYSTNTVVAITQFMPCALLATVTIDDCCPITKKMAVGRVAILRTSVRCRRAFACLLSNVGVAFLYFTTYERFLFWTAIYIRIRFNGPAI